ncbi:MULTISPECIES: helix-turn-helix domain-containing protein [Intestinimonas]|jgi:transcriptional regulator with XRE-family HTH domain|uniref:helix-turn-helix domain-containing protein n=1 Tax=Intestinimonas TaxID=1392389 RepID=UPI00051AF35C|nr:helix-turn-helix transcriptional regulator [Intestinimonas butyriciproducens]MBO3279295.1 helix-turn-helix transcriptional regulator [Intestinimonas butyriciproducens]MDB7815615.1 helix-turn-helix transcriptional regulator [Intestinimonas butyriciproducens]MDB7844680.1 helix-turn-helix transcriptional regulator [Intestinimonas butyriciproducens]MDB7856637.1 helix-turn-helix transcriptional regulator [Intestinimonas butyriciproducens]
MEFYVRLKELRKEAGETQKMLASAIGISVNQVIRFEKGEQKPGFDNLWALADHFGVTVDYLMGRTDENRK